MNPVVLVHGWGGSFRTTWQKTGWEALLTDAGRTVIGVDLLGHGRSAKPHDPADYGDLTSAIESATDGIERFDAIGFSLGAMTLLEFAVRHPGRIDNLVLCGIGANVFRDDETAHESLVRALKGEDTDNITARLFVQYAEQDGNDRAALTACMEARRDRLTTERLQTVTSDCLVVIGDRDFAGPGDPLVEALPVARLVTLPKIDHFATPESFGCIDAALEFLDAVPA